jgi:hypothetical protein
MEWIRRLDLPKSAEPTERPEEVLAEAIMGWRRAGNRLEKGLKGIAVAGQKPTRKVGKSGELPPHAKPGQKSGWYGDGYPWANRLKLSQHGEAKPAKTPPKEALRGRSVRCRAVASA